MRVTVIHGSNDIYGASKVLLNEVKALVHLGHEVTILVPAEGALESKLAHFGAKVHLVVDPRLSILRRSRLRDVMKARTLPEDVIQADLVILWTLALVPYVVPLLVRRKPFYISVHELLRGLAGAILVRVFLAPFRFGVQACSHATASWLRQNGVAVERIVVAYPIIDLSRRGPQAQTARSPGAGFAVAVVGRVNGSKGHGDVIRAFTTELIDNRDWVLNLYGAPYPGQESALREVQALAQRDPRVRYLGEVEDFALIASENDLLACFPRKPEPFGLVPVDGWLHGVRSVGWNTGGAAEVLAIVDGTAVEPVRGDETEIAVALLDAHSVWEWAQQLPSRSAVAPHFSVEQRLRGVEQLVEGATAVRPMAPS